MSTTSKLPNVCAIPSPEETLQAKDALSQLKEALSAVGFDESRRELMLQACVGSGRRASQAVPIPGRVVPLLLELLQSLADGNAVMLVPHHAELTTQEAADLLNVSRPFLIGLLDAGKIPHRMVGAHRRIAAADVFQYKQREAEAREKTLAELAAEAQELNMGY
jgi:excisionase family DNA binding protein